MQSLLLAHPVACFAVLLAVLVFTFVARLADMR
jgi:hypothetical protein